MNILTWIVFGLIAGIVAEVVDPHKDTGGIVGAVILGILGAIIGGFVANLVFGVSITGFNLTSFAIAILGSLLLLFISRAFRSYQ